MDKNAISLGLRIGRILAGQRRKREPIAYLYGSVKAPALPQSDLPYAVIFTWNNITTCLLLSSTTTYRLYDEPGFFGSQDGNSVGYRLKDGTWVEYGIGLTYHADEKACTPSSVTSVKWANYDVMVKDKGTVSVSASEPVPVYE